MSTHATIQALYLAIYNRPADWDGLLYWASQHNTNSFEEISQAFTQSPEFADLYAGLDANDQINALYQHLLGRDADPEGQNYWAERLESGETFADVVRYVINAVTGQDASILEQRVNDALTQTYSNLMDMLYAGYYGRAPDAEGKAYWVEAMQSAEGNLGLIVEAFGNSDEYMEKYADLDSRAQITALYDNMFNREPDAEGATYWAEKLDNGSLTLSTLAFTLAQSAAAVDKQAFEENIAVLNEP
ncbi:MAG: DUF4214 domain-containing protein, partial [Halomonadaceae bacterium]